MKRYPGSLTIGASCLMAASAIIGWSAGGHQGHAHGAPVPARAVGDTQVIYHYGESIPNLPDGMRLDIAMDTWPGTYDQALHECDRLGGEPVTYSWLPDVTQMVCEHVDY